MKKYGLIIFAAVVIIFNFTFTGFKSEEKMQDGFYTAIAKEFYNGWKEYVCIFVKDGKIISAEYNAMDASGYIKAWDNEYMRNMSSRAGTYPNAYTRGYIAQLLSDQNAESIDVISGATHSHGIFSKLAVAVIESAKKGEHEKVIVDAG